MASAPSQSEAQATPSAASASLGALLQGHYWWRVLLVRFLPPADALRFRLCCRAADEVHLEKRLLRRRGGTWGGSEEWSASPWQTLHFRWPVHSVLLDFRWGKLQDASADAAILVFVGGACVARVYAPWRQLWFGPPNGKIHELRVTPGANGMVLEEVRCWAVVFHSEGHLPADAVPDGSYTAEAVSSYYEQFNSHHPMTFHEVTMTAGWLSGSGVDDIAKFSIAGEYDAEATFYFVKQYEKGHAVRYSGTISMTEAEVTLTGHWHLYDESGSDHALLIENADSAFNTGSMGMTLRRSPV